MATLPTCVCAALRQVTRAVTQLYDDALRPSGLRTMQFQILMTFKYKGESTISELVPLLLLDQTTLTRSLAILGKQKWVERVTSPDANPDRRRKAYRLASEGERVLALAMPRWAAVQKEVLARMTPEAWQQARAPLGALLD